MWTKLTKWIDQRTNEAAILKEKLDKEPIGTDERRVAEINYFDALAKIRGAYEFVEWLENNNEI